MKVYLLGNEGRTQGHGESFPYTSLATIGLYDKAKLCPAFYTRESAEEYKEANRIWGNVIELELQES